MSDWIRKCADEVKRARAQNQREMDAINAENREKSREIQKHWEAFLRQLKTDLQTLNSEFSGDPYPVRLMPQDSTGLWINGTRKRTGGTLDVRIKGGSTVEITTEISRGAHIERKSFYKSLFEDGPDTISRAVIELFLE